MAILDTLSASEIQVGDLIGFTIGDGDDTADEILRVEFLSDTGSHIEVTGYSEVWGDTETYRLDPYGPVDLLGA